MTKSEESWKDICSGIWNDVFSPGSMARRTQWTGDEADKHAIASLEKYEESLHELMVKKLHAEYGAGNRPFLKKRYAEILKDALAVNKVNESRSQLLTGFHVLMRFERNYSDSYKQINRARRAELTQLYISRVLTSLTLAAVLVGTYWVADLLEIQMPMTAKVTTPN